MRANRHGATEDGPFSLLASSARQKILLSLLRWRTLRIAMFLQGLLGPHSALALSRHGLCFYLLPKKLLDQVTGPF
jgi:hypothetical protein